MKSLGLKEKITPLILFLETRSGLRNHQTIMEPGNNNFSVVFFSDPVTKVILFGTLTCIISLLFNPFFPNAGAIDYWYDIVSFSHVKNIFGVNVHLKLILLPML